MTHLVNISEMAAARGLAVVDMETGQVLGTHLRLIHISDHAEERIRSSAREARTQAAGWGIPLYVDVDEHYGTDMRDALLLGDVPEAPDTPAALVDEAPPE